VVVFRRAPNVTWSVVGSVLAHVLVLGAGIAAYRSLADRRAREAEAAAALGTGPIAIELPGVAEGTLLDDAKTIPEGSEPQTFGGAVVARIDTGSPGRGGEVAGSRATNLAAIDDQLRLDPDMRSHLDRDQVQRIKNAQHRTTREDRRSTTHPMELTFLVTGKGALLERRAEAPDPSRGMLVARAPSVVGGTPGAATTNDAEEGATPGAARDGQSFESAGVGLRGAAAGSDHHRGARIGFARPSVAEGTPSIPGIWNGKPKDTVDSDQEVASTVRSLIHASHAGGFRGEGHGGSEGEGQPGSGGGPVGASAARPLGSGDGELVDWNSSDPTLMPYLRKIHEKVDPLWANAFPKSAMLELKQGTVILELTVASDGAVKVTWPPIRPSGIEEFDRNCADAVRRAAPFDPLPAALRKDGRSILKIRAPFIAKNPVIK
jgi:TonB family protein